MINNLFRSFRWVFPLVWVGSQVLAQGDDHQPLATSETLGFAEILDNALKNAPEAGVTEARGAQAAAYQGMGRGWLASRPSVVASYLDDSRLDNQGQKEIEYGVQLPLWRPGEKRDTARLADDYSRQSDLWQQSLRLTLAGRVRTLLADIAEAEQILAIERQATADSEQLQAVTTRLFETGALSRLDVMQSENQLLQQRQREIQANAAMLDAEIVYRMTTGLLVRPAATPAETMASATEISPEHPLLRLLQSEVDVAGDNVRQSEISAKGNPQLTLGTRREQGNRFSPTIDTLTLSLQVPFGGKHVVAARTSTARLAKVDAEVGWRSTQRELQLALHEAEHELDVTREALPLASQQAALDAERSTLAQRAFDAGELTLAQVLAAVVEAHNSARTLVQLQNREQRLIADYNQALGVLP